jgi:hypothetical protein
MEKALRQSLMMSQATSRSSSGDPERCSLIAALLLPLSALQEVQRGPRAVDRPRSLNTCLGG